MKFFKSTWCQSLYPLLIFGSVPVFIEATEANPYVIGITRLSIASLLILFFSKSPKTLLKSLRINIKLFLFMGSVFWVHWISYFWAIKGSSASYGILGLSTYGIQLILLSSFVSKRKLNLVQYFTLVLILISLVLIAEPSAKVNLGKGLLWGTVSAFFYALIPIINQKYKHIPHQERVFGMFSITALFFCLFTSWGNWTDLTFTDSYQLLYMAVAGTFIAHNLWIKFTTEQPGWLSGILYYQVIPITLILNNLINKEFHSTSKYLGATLLIFANLIQALDNRSKKRIGN